VRWRKCVERQGDFDEKWYTCVLLLFNKSHVKKYLRFSFDSPSYIWWSGPVLCHFLHYCFFWNKFEEKQYRRQPRRLMTREQLQWRQIFM
jgi:hypothetical protein